MERISKDHENFCGDKFCQHADYVLTNSNSFFELSRSERKEQAISFYKSAIYHYKLAKIYRKVVETYTAIAELELDSECGHYQAASNYSLAANFYLKIDRSMSILYYKIAIELYLKDGKFSTLARTLETLGEIYKESSSISEAIDTYEKAFKYYEIEDSPTAAYRCLLESSYMLIRIKEYQRALIHLEKVANYYASSVFPKSRYTQVYFEVIVIHMFLGNIVECKRLLNKYKPTLFGKSKEYDALNKAINAYENHDADAFSQAIRNLNTSWSLDLLLKIKEISLI